MTDPLPVSRVCCLSVLIQRIQLQNHEYGSGSHSARWFGKKKIRNRGAPNYLCFVTVILDLNSEICFLSYIEVCVNTLPSFLQCVLI